MLMKNNMDWSMDSVSLYFNAGNTKMEIGESKTEWTNEWMNTIIIIQTNKAAIFSFFSPFQQLNGFFFFV